MNEKEEAKYKKLSKENKQLKKEIRALEDKVARLELSLKNYTETDPFIDAHGVKWKRGADGAIEPVVYCVECELVMTPFPADNPQSFHCTKCGSKAPFGMEDMEALVSALESLTRNISDDEIMDPSFVSRYMDQCLFLRRKGRAMEAKKSRTPIDEVEESVERETG